MKAINKEAILNLSYPYNLQSNGTIYGDNFGCSSQKNNYYNTYQVFNDVPQSFYNLGTNITWYYPTSANLTQIQIRLTTSASNPSVHGYIQVLQGSTWADVQYYSASGDLTTINLSISGYYKSYRITFSSPSSYDNISFSNIIGTYKGTGTDLIPQITRKYYKYQTSSWTQPVLNWNGFLGYDDFAVSVSSVYQGDAWQLFAGSVQTYGWTSANSAYPHIYTMYSKIPLNITNIQVTNYTATSYVPKNWVIYGSNDNSNWTQLNSGENTDGTANATWNITTNTNNYYNYYKIEFTNHISGSGYYIRIGLFTLTAIQKVPIESTSSDYDYYKDITEYKAVA